eukprot:GEMP01091637.1.p1 GENE.GEMP01091637.1~~GEMP01091637.1.p1  ORF type:complete len:209 (+),score=54.98 GEMP01091637.1:125-751(+)
MRNISAINVVSDRHIMRYRVESPRNFLRKRTRLRHFNREPQCNTQSADEDCNHGTPPTGLAADTEECSSTSLTDLSRPPTAPGGLLSRRPKKCISTAAPLTPTHVTRDSEEATLDDHNHTHSSVLDDVQTFLTTVQRPQSRDRVYYRGEARNVPRVRGSSTLALGPVSEEQQQEVDRTLAALRRHSPRTIVRTNSPGGNSPEVGHFFS